ncbi:winged helix-turn-helix domain-containing protein [Promicromonospora citrea]|uniref:Transcriptional regulator n=1 Tax=Promicromonospora citrea TaxID=43677 RepID=A0A8H9GDA1_9MICO|nr:helix-turn-helix domain-containing protein [Promicromonospora citrea]NNH53136.1 helix-turn-helix transcriptional regulator [Promicromonospora citrea]GGM10102.1 transcriptional regulator [Promicromonospora citrea]
MATFSDDFRLTPEAVKVLAHPLRSRLLSALRKGGPATATALATALSTNSGATSYHLRKLASVGLVTDTGEGTGKQRIWRAATSSHSWERTELAHDEDAATALGWLERDYLRLFTTEFGRWLDVAEAWPDEWQDAAGFGDAWVTVTPDQLKALRRDLQEVLDRYLDAEPQPGARRITFWQAAFPLDPDDVPSRDDDPDATEQRKDRS